MVSGFILSLVSFLQTIKFNYVYLALFLYLGLFWIAYTIWLWQDTQLRFKNKVISRIVWVIISITFIFGFLLYLLARPSKSGDEDYYLELERRLIKFESNGLISCELCGYDLRPDFLNCPLCGKIVRHRCTKCRKLVDENWGFCPYCLTLVNKNKLKSKLISL